MLISLSGLPGTGETRRAGLAVEGVGYEIGQAGAADNLALGRTVIADCVNPWPLTRDAWQQVGQHRHVRVTASAPNGNCRFS
jgi:hypothetical protein